VKRAVSSGLTAVLIAVSLVIGAAAGFFAYPAVVPPSEKIVEKVVEKPVEKIVEVVKQPPPAPEAIKIGYSISLTGAYAATAKRQHEGVLLWADWVNRQGGIFVKEYNSRIPVKLVWYDDESNTDRAIALYERLITVDKVDFLLGPYGSPLTAAVAPIAEKYKKVMISSMGSDDYIFEQGYKYIVQPLTPASYYFHSTLEMVKALDPAAKKVAIIYRDVAFTKTAAEGARDYATKLGFEVVYFKSYPDKVTDLTPLLTELKFVGADILLVGSHIADGTLAAKQLKELNINFKLISIAVAITEPAFVQALGEKAVEGLVGPSQWEVGYSLPKVDFGPTAEEWIALYTKLAGVEPTYHATGGFAGALVLHYAIEKAGTLDNDKVRQVFNELSFTTAYGAFKIDPATGKQIAHKMVLVQWQGGKKVIVWPPEGATAKPIYPIPPWDKKG